MDDLEFLDEVVNAGERLRADARQTVQTILSSADRVLARHPTATLDEIAADAGVARTTIYRRFATRDALLTALARWAVHQVVDAIEAAAPQTAPPYVALYQATVNVLRVKVNQSFTRTMSDSTDPAVVAAHAAIVEKAEEMLTRTQAAGLLRADVSIPWARQVYYALLHEALFTATPDTDPNELATLLLTTFLGGVGSPGRPDLR